jgi:hypothetical protein
LPFIVPQNYQTERSIYRDRGHSGSLSWTINPVSRIQAVVGGDFFRGTEGRPTRFYNPRARLSMKLSNDVSWIGDWRWHEYSNLAFSREAFRAHLLATGVQYRF